MSFDVVSDKFNAMGASVPNDGHVLLQIQSKLLSGD